MREAGRAGSGMVVSSRKMERALVSRSSHLVMFVCLLRLFNDETINNYVMIRDQSGSNNVFDHSKDDKS